MKAILKTGLLVAMLFEIYSCRNNTTVKAPTQENKPTDTIYAKTFKSNDGWGYSVFVNDKQFIRQSFIPVIEGNKPFANEADAKNVATLVIVKLKNHEKPTVRREELVRLDIE